jgi:hypothetical protein
MFTNADLEGDLGPAPGRTGENHKNLGQDRWSLARTQTRYFSNANEINHYPSNLLSLLILVKYYDKGSGAEYDFARP